MKLQSWLLILFFSVVVMLGHPACSLGQGIPHLRELEKSDSLEIKDAKVSKGSEARSIAERAYFNKMKGSILANESPGAPVVVVLGFDISDFGKRGDRVWEIKFSCMTPEGSRALRAILWVHPMTEKVYFVIGPWSKND